MDGSHPSTDPVLHRHIVTMDWYRAELDAALAFEPRWDLGLQIPYDVKDEKVRYELPDGSSYDSPTGSIHHRTETLEGVADLRILANFRPAGLFTEGDQARLGFGLSLPTGRTEENPYELAAQGIEHQHIQFGTGTVDPLLALEYSFRSGLWGFDVAFRLQAPLYKNSKGYRGSTILDAAVGPRVQATEWLGLAVHYTPVYQTRAWWDGEPDENSGYTLHGLALSAPIRLSSSAMLMPMVMRTIDVAVRSGADIFEMDWMAGLSFELSFGRAMGDRPGEARPEGRREP